VHNPGFAKEYQPCELTLNTSEDSREELPPAIEFIFYQRRDVHTPCGAPR